MHKIHHKSFYGIDKIIKLFLAARTPQQTFILLKKNGLQETRIAMISQNSRHYKLPFF